MEYIIRELKESEYTILSDFLYEAIFIPEGVPAPDKSIIENPDLQVYIKDFGRKTGDHCLAAEASGSVIGAVWARIMDDYGHVDNDTPSLAISLYREYRGMGIGTALMKRMLALLKERGFRKASLSVQKHNYAVKMYSSLGFQILREKSGEYIMTIDLRAPDISDQKPE